MFDRVEKAIEAIRKGEQAGQGRRDSAVLDLRHERTRSRRRERGLTEARGDPAGADPLANRQPRPWPELLAFQMFSNT